MRILFEFCSDNKVGVQATFWINKFICPLRKGDMIDVSIIPQNIIDGLGIEDNPEINDYRFEMDNNGYFQHVYITEYK